MSNPDIDARADIDTDGSIHAVLQALIAAIAPTPAVAMLIDREGRLVGTSGQAINDSMWTAALLAHELESNPEFEQQLLRGGGVRVAGDPHAVHVLLIAERAVLVLMVESTERDPVAAAASLAPSFAQALAHLPRLGEPELRALFRS